MSTQTNQPPPQPQDISARVQELARIIDRLPPGKFEITIEKPEVRAADWRVDVVRLEKLQHITLPKIMPDSGPP
jgi:hypothetical protein